MKNQTWNDLVRNYFSNSNNYFCSKVLWNATCFPFGKEEDIQNNLKELKRIFSKRKFKNNKVLLSNIMAYSDNITEKAMRSI